MTNKKQEINDLFSMFHDFEIASVSMEGNVMNLIVEIPWGKNMDPNNSDNQITVELVGCKYLKCEYYPFIKSKVNQSMPKGLQKTETKVISSPITIGTLGLEVQSHTFTLPDIYVLHCNSSKEIAGGELTFTATDYKIFDKDCQQIALDKMKEGATAWWNSIQDMWDDQKK